MHIPVLCNEVIASFESCQLKRFIDGTVGAGGHAKAILQAHPENIDFYAVDRDEKALEIARDTLQDFPTVHYIHANFAELEIQEVDGILLDLGVSSMQLDQGERGFSFSKPGPLDMRMDVSQQIDAKYVVNTYSEKELARIFWEYGEERRSKRAAEAIVQARKKKRIESTEQLCEILRPHLGWQKRHFNPMTLIFQALRIEVNQELVLLEKGLLSALNALREGGRLAVISFHSLEDRIVKQTFKQLASDTKSVEILTKKPLIASQEECRANPRSRSAKLRVVQKCSL